MCITNRLKSAWAIASKMGGELFDHMKEQMPILREKFNAWAS